MDVRSPFFQNVATVLIGVLFLNPIMAAAAEVTLTAANTNTSITAAGNGVPVVNIATPNGNGLSHNKFTDYNVGQQGLILNNATGKTQGTQLGGIILGNANLQGQAANLILNEVTGGSPSQLQGYTEVAGQQAHVVVANPNGITCNGCGFINTPRATLTTGKPIIEGGRLDHLQVDGGAISIEGAGLNASNVDQFDLITRSAKLNAELHANQLNVITGANDVKVADLAVNKRVANQVDAPQLAIDSSALGGMYAGAIRLVGTEQGVGVKLAGNMAASAGDIQIDANGQLSLAQTAATGNVRIAAESLELNGKVYAGNSVTAQASGELSNKQSLAARSGISLQAGEVVNQGVIEAGVNADNSRNGVGDVSIAGQRLRNTGTVAASRTLDVAVDALDNRSGTLSGKAQAQIQAGQLDNRQGRVLSQGTLTVQAATLDNSQSGLINGQSGLSVQSSGLNNQAGEISTRGNGQVTAANLDNRQGTLIGENGLQVTASGNLNNSQGGVVSSNTSLQVSAGSLNNSADGALVSQGALTATVAGALDNHDGGALISQGKLAVTADTLDNRNAGTLSSQTDLQVATASLANQGGRIVSEGALNLSSAALDNSQQGTVSSKGSARVEAASLNNSSGGSLVTDGHLLLVAGRVDNGAQGRIAAQGDLNAQIEVLEQRSGELLSQGRLTLTGQRLDNSAAGLLAANQGIDLQVGQIDNRGGEISSRAAVAITADDLDNSASGTIIGDAGLRLTVERMLNSALGRLLGRDALIVRGASLDNSAGGTLSSQQSLDIALSGDLNNSDNGALVSEGLLNLNARALNNQAGTVSSAGNLVVNASGGLDNRRGKLVTDGELQLASSRLDNSAGTISGKTATRVQTGDLINQGGRLVGGTSLTLSAAKVDNRNQGLLAAGSTLTATVTELDQRGAGQLVSEGALTLDMQRGALNNSEHGLLAASGPLLLNNLGAVNNGQGGEISSNRSFALVADSLNNQGGRVISGQALMLRINQILINSLSGVLSGAEALSLQAASVDNAGGSVASRGDIGVDVAGALNNSAAGTLSAGGQLDVSSASLDNSAQGLLASGGNLLLDTGAINNRDGQLLSQRALQIAAGDVDNRHGVIGSEQALQLDAARVDNQAGLINSGDRLALTATTLDSSSQGEVSAQQDLVLSVNQLIQRQGRLIAGAALSLDLHDGSLDNRGGLISAQGPLTLANLRSLDNRGGELSSNASFLVRATSIDNGEQGRIISSGTLSLEAATLRNAGEGLLSGWQGLDVTGGSLDNSGKGTLSSRNGALSVELSGALNNSAEGALASQGDLWVEAASLDNSDKGILSTEGRLDLTLAGDLDNHDQGLLSAEGAVAIQARDVNNGAGQIVGHSLLLTGHNLDNSAGQLSSDTTLNLNLLGTLTNTNQAQLASGADLLLRAGAVDNRGGTLVSRGLLDVIAGSFNNSAGGTLAAQQALSIALSGALDNSQDGLIYSLDDQLSLQAGSINNNAGTLQSKDDFELEVTGALSNQQGRISSGEGNVQVQAASLDNSAAGMLYGIAGWLRLTVAGLFNNNGGVTQARSLDIQSGDLNNAAGHLSATQGDNHIVAGAFNNQGGGLYAGQRLDLTASSFENQNGQVAAAAIDFGLGGALNNSSGIVESSSTLSLTSASLFNGNGKLRALGMQGDTLIRTGTLDNRLGVLETANSNLKLELGSLLNADGRIQHVGTGNLDLASAQAMAAGGTLATNGQLSISAQNWVNSGVLQAARLLLNVDQFSQTASGQLLASESLTASSSTWNNDGLLASDGTLSLTLTGAYSGSGTLSSLDDLSLTASSVSLGMNGRISGGALTTLNSSGAVTNRGRLTSAGDLRISAGSLNNYGTLGSGENLRLAAANLLNEYGLIFSGEDMVLRADALINNQADIYSMGTLSIARDDANGLLTSLENRSGSIESLADMTLRAALLTNQKDSFSTSKNQTYGHFSIVCYDCSGDHHNVDYVATERFDIAVAEDSAAASIHSGGNLDIQGTDVVNRYSSLSASGNILINAATLENTGAATGTLERVRRFNTGRVTDGTDERFRDRYIYPYNAQPLPKEVPDALYRWNLVSDIETSTPTGIASAAIIQAGGNVVIQASQSLSNQSILAYQAPQAGTAQSVATGVSAASQPLQVTLNPQLPPDLAQQQVNPLTLPGFSLPQGDNGLFRLSGQQGESAQQTDVQHGVRDLTLSAPSIAATSFEQSLGYVDAQGRTFGSPGAGSAAVAAVGAAQGQQSIAGTQPLPGTSLPAGAHRYLIETNPELTNLKSFLGSDYLLGNLGLTPDNMQKRLGDGLYEQRLIREAIVARTGQRYLAGLTSDEAMFRYLMDNAIASKSALNLSLGVSLSAAQIAALTHDIVWMEEHEVLGEKVLVPVLYLAQAEGRMAPNGALIQGRDVALISGGSLTNSGTLRASQSLSATANAIGNSGLMQANERLSLLATGSIRNAQGGIIAGRDVSAIALTGDIINERSITHEARSGRGFSQLTSVVDKAAGIEASNALVLSAGRDIQNIGGRLQAGGDATLSAGRDLMIASAAAENGSMRKDKRHFWETTSTTQYGSDVQVGGDLEVQAGSDLAVVASTVKAGGDIAFGAGNDVTIASAANESSSEYRYKRSDKKINKEDSSVQQQASVIEAGGDLDITADNNLIVSASQLKAGDEAYLYAGDQLALLSAEDSDYSLYDYKKKGSWGSNEAKRDEVTDVRNIGSTITTGGDLTLESGGDQLYRKAELDSGGDLTLDSGGAVTFEAVKDTHQESHDESSGSWVWTSMDSKGKVDETLRQSQLTAKGEVLISAVDGLHIDVKQVNQQTVSQSIDAMVQADPSMAWLKEVEARGDVDWRQVREVHDQWSESHSGLGGPAMIVIAIIVTYFTAGAASGVVASGASAAGASTAAGSAWAAGTAATAATTTTAATAATAAGWANVAATAVLTSAASTATISTINNKGDVGAALKETFNSDNLKNYVVAGTTAGLTAGLYNEWTGTQTGGSTALTDSTSGALANGGKVAVSNPGGLSSWQGVGQFAANQALQNTTSAVLNKALGRDGSLGDALQTSLANTFAAFGFNLVGDIGDDFDLKDGRLPKIGLHAVMGGLAAEAAGGDFKTGALAAGVNEALVDTLAQQYGKMDPDEKKKLLVMNSQLIGVLSTAIQDPDADAEKLQTGSWVAQNSTQYNYLFHAEIEKMLSEQAACASQKCKQDVAERYADLDSARNDGLADLCTRSPATCDTILSRLAAEEPAVLELAHQQAGAGNFDAAAVIGFSIAQNNSTATQLIVRELSGETELQGAFGDALLATATGGAGRGGSTKPSATGEAGAGTVGAKGTGSALGNAERGVLTEANFAQNRIKSDRSFSPDGQKIYSDLAGKPIKTVDDLADALKVGTIKPSQLPVDYVDMNGTRLILNTRTSTALEQAGIPRSQWFGRNQTGVEAYPGKTFNDLAADQLKNNKLPPTGAEKLKSVRP
ncbi:two-partner secretion domain-containing protein [Aquipseudomonas alcaligenes]|uniref:Hemagglutinin n=1 Tax=Aquipseudomonas alcaligenes TaxID=43263 RepID=A0AA37CM20_AQUAC|nr:filamentous hemagglutinin N-terminal domain-containing protein [Pseudomonas alcaligenes]BCR24369.1 hemagglutinin [Pseudomonas alcaligenes]GIZ68754.1 hemagglutinin [Pseudomonas alcaligenes]GIZ73105.1 hemagglutinin [Pseudomonas alcaligenes]GIZ77488.1 hemagglutinin [Pseudomonas alcaligenes]GIZ81798.1 hemagglutinin [Pseudomonas alcaligenes]